MSLSPDGRTLAICVRRDSNSNTRLARIGVDGSGYREFVPSLVAGPLAWTGDDWTKAEAMGDGFIAGNAIAVDADVPIAVCGVAGTVAGDDTIIVVARAVSGDELVEEFRDHLEVQP